MKRFLAMLSAVAMCLFLVACNSSANQHAANPSPATSAASTAQSTSDIDWPKSPVSIIVPGKAGSGGDLAARTVAPYIEKYLGTKIVVEDVDGSNGAIAYNQVAHNTKADGYTMIFMPFPGIATQEVADEACTFSLNDFIPTNCIGSDPNVLCVANDNGKFSTLEEFVAYCKEHPGEVSVAVGNASGDDQIAMTDFCEKAGIEVTYVIYTTSSDRMAPLMGGHIDAAVWNCAETTGLGDSVNCLGVMAPERYFSLPDIPTFIEQGYDCDHAALRGLGFPAGVDEEIVKKMSDAVGRAMEDPECIEAFKKAGIQVRYEDYITYNETQHTLQDAFREQWASAEHN